MHLFGERWACKSLENELTVLTKPLFPLRLKAVFRGWVLGSLSGLRGLLWAHALFLPKKKNNKKGPEKDTFP